MREAGGHGSMWAWGAMVVMWVVGGGNGAMRGNVESLWAIMGPCGVV